MNVIKDLSNIFGEPVRIIHEVDVKAGVISERYYVYVAGVGLRAEGLTLDEAISKIQSR